MQKQLQELRDEYLSKYVRTNISAYNDIQKELTKILESSEPRKCPHCNNDLWEHEGNVYCDWCHVIWHSSKLPKLSDWVAVKDNYCGEEGETNMKSDIKEIMHAAGDQHDFIRLCNEAREELDEAAFDLDQKSRMNGV